MTATVHQDHGMMRRNGQNLVAPIVGIREAAVQKNHGRTLAVDRIVDLDAIGFGFAAAVRGDRRRGRRQRLPPLRRIGGEFEERDEGSEGELAYESSPGKRSSPRQLSPFPPLPLSFKRATGSAHKDAPMTARRYRYSNGEPA
jgi:hypothetical protein